MNKNSPPIVTLLFAIVGKALIPFTMVGIALTFDFALAPTVASTFVICLWCHAFSVYVKTDGKRYL